MSKSNPLNNTESQTTLKRHEGISKFNIEKIRPGLRAELDRRIRESAELIPECLAYNRIELIENALHSAHASGWLSSNPARETVDKEIYLKAKEIPNPFIGKGEELDEVACVNIDLGHKLISSINATIAKQGGAIAAVWHTRTYPTEEYSDFQDEHQTRNDKVFLIRDSWAKKEGLVKVSIDGYLDEITQPQDCFMCFCNLGYVYSLRKLPPEMLTAEGKKKLRLAETTQKPIATCLLYTSPSPRDRTRSRMPSSA